MFENTNQFKKIKNIQKVRKESPPQEKDDVFLTDLLKRAEKMNYDFDPNLYANHK